MRVKTNVRVGNRQAGALDWQRDIMPIDVWGLIPPEQSLWMPDGVDKSGRGS